MLDAGHGREVTFRTAIVTGTDSDGIGARRRWRSPSAAWIGGLALMAAVANQDALEP